MSNDTFNQHLNVDGSLHPEKDAINPAGLRELIGL
jgi:hypothetical protein